MGVAMSHKIKSTIHLTAFLNWFSILLTSQIRGCDVFCSTADTALSPGERPERRSRNAPRVGPTWTAVSAGRNQAEKRDRGSAEWCQSE